jgi:hypothetical protein
MSSNLKFKGRPIIPHVIFNAQVAVGESHDASELVRLQHGTQATPLLKVSDILCDVDPLSFQTEARAEEHLLSKDGQVLCERLAQLR